MDTIKIQLEYGDIHENWYNIASDFKTPMLPPLHPGTGEPVGPEALAPLFPMAIIQQEVSQERWIEIPDAGVGFARTWAIVPAPEANHVVKGAIDEALRCEESGESKCIAVNLCGHGHFDMAAYQAYFAGQLERHEFTDEMLRENMQALSELPTV